MKNAKRLLSVLLSLMLMLSVVAVGGMTASAELPGDGTADNPYRISDYAELKAFASMVNGGATGANAKLTKDIVAPDKEWTPIGNNLKRYTGTFDGDGHTITGLSNAGVANAPDEAGLFGHVGEGGVIQYVGLNGGAIKGKYAGGIVGDNRGTVKSCYNSAEITGKTESCVGGIVGENKKGEIIDCSNTGTVSQSDDFSDVGGIAGSNDSGKITGCYNTGKVITTGSDVYVGGILGNNYDYNSHPTLITDCYNTGAVTATGNKDNVGGIVGLNSDEHIKAEIASCYNAGTVTASGSECHLGGIAGENYPNATVTNCYYDKTVCGEIGAVNGADDDTNNVTGLTTAQMTGSNAADNMKGLFNDDGSSDDWCITASYPKFFIKIGNYAELKAFASRVNNGETGLCAVLTDDIDASASDENDDWTPIGNDYGHRYTGTFDGSGKKITGLTFNNTSADYVGLFGRVGEGGIVQNVGLEGGSITGQCYVGGVVGCNSGNSSVENCYNTGDVSGIVNVGGVVGFVYGTVSNCYNTGSVTATEDGAYVGGVIGQHMGTVTNCYNTGDVSSSEYVGGVVGDNNGGTITNCYNTGDVSGNNRVGGVAGDNDNGTITNCYNTGSVTATEQYAYAGGVVGDNNVGTIKYCYYDKSVCGEIGAVDGADDDTNNVTGLTTAEMTGENALENMVFEYRDGEVSPWLTKADEAGDGGKYRLFYPHLKGFNFNDDLTQMTGDEIKTADWPAKAEVSVIWSEEYSYTYNGQAQMPSASITIGDIALKPGADYTVSYKVKTDDSWGDVSEPVNAGEYKAAVTLKSRSIEKEFKINSKAVIITAASEAFIYDGKQHSNNGYEVTGLEGSDAINAVVSGSITYTSESPAANVINSYEFTSGSSGNYTVTTQDGELTMSNGSAAITITAASGEWTYDGSAHSDETVTVTSGSLFEGDTLVAQATGSVTDVSETAEGNNPIAPDYRIMHGTEDVTANYTITAVPGTLTVNPVIKFMNEDGTELQSGAVAYGETPEYTGEIPAKDADEWYTYSFDKWTPEVTEATDNATYTAAYTSTKIEYKAIFVDESGKTVKEVPYTVETESITPPDVPAKEGYEGKWEEYKLTAGGITVKPVYTEKPAEETPEEPATPLTIEGNRRSVLGYKENQTFTADVADLPEGAEIHWFVNGEDAGTGSEYKVVGPKDDYTVQAKVIDKDGNVLSESAEQSITVKHGFLDKILFFFAYLLKLLLTPVWYLEDIL